MSKFFGSEITDMESLITNTLVELAPDFDIISVFKPARQLKFIADQELRGVRDAESWEFKPDWVVVLKDRQNSEKEVAFLNVSKGTLGLTELGELRVMALLAQPRIAIQLAPLGLSRDLYSVWLDAEIQDRIANFGKSKMQVATFSNFQSLTEAPLLFV